MNEPKTHRSTFSRCRPRCLAAILAAALLVPFGSASAAPDAVPAQFQGRWVSATAACDSPVRVVIAADRMTLENGTDSQAIGDIEMAGPGYFAHDYKGIMAVLITEFSGQQPVTGTFNVGEKRGTAQMDFAPVMPGKPTPQLNAYNGRISKLNLAKRFPLDKVLLKKCPG